MTETEFEKIKQCARLRVEARGDDPTFDVLLAEVGVLCTPADPKKLENDLREHRLRQRKEQIHEMKKELARLEASLKDEELRNRR